MPDERDAPAEGLLRLFRAAPFRLTLLSLALFAFAGAAFMAYVYVAAAGEARRRTDAEIRREADSLVEVYDRAGHAPDQRQLLLAQAILEQAQMGQRQGCLMRQQ